MEIKSDEYIIGKGTPRIRLLDEQGNVIQEYTNHNLIVKLGRSAIIKLLNGDFLSSITKCSLGTKGYDTDPNTPVAPTENDTELYAEVLGARKNITSWSYGFGASPTEITYTTIFTSIIVNAEVSETGLYFDDGTLFARFTFPSMYLKDDKGYALEVAWTIQF